MKEGVLDIRKGRARVGQSKAAKASTGQSTKANTIAKRVKGVECKWSVENSLWRMVYSQSGRNKVSDKQWRFARVKDSHRRRR